MFGIVKDIFMQIQYYFIKLSRKEVMDGYGDFLIPNENIIHLRTSWERLLVLKII